MMKLESSSDDSKILYTTDGSEPKDSGAVYAADFVIPPNTSFISAIAEKQGIYSNKLEIPVSWSKTKKIKIDKSKKIIYERKGMYSTNSTKETYEELELFDKFKAQYSGVYLNYTCNISGKEHWANTMFDESFEWVRFLFVGPCGRSG